MTADVIYSGEKAGVVFWDEARRAGMWIEATASRFTIRRKEELHLRPSSIYEICGYLLRAERNFGVVPLRNRRRVKPRRALAFREKGATSRGL